MSPGLVWKKSPSAGIFRTGPIEESAIRDQSGKERFAAGVSATKADLASMNYYVEGIKADLPK